MKHSIRRGVELLSLGLILICALLTFWMTRPQATKGLALSGKDLVYTGTLHMDKPNGNGSLTFENGDRYKGGFNKGVFQGQGTYTSAAGWSYQGTFHKGQADGQGKLTLSDGTVYEGTFKQGIYQQ